MHRRQYTVSGPMRTDAAESAPADALRLRLLLGGGALLGALFVLLLQDTLPGRVRALIGVVCFIAALVACSADIRAIRWRTVGWGIALQLVLAVLILRLEIGGVRPGFELFSALAAAATRMFSFTDAGTRLVFGVLADPEALGRVFPDGLIFAFTGLPIVIFASALSAVLYHLGVLQFVVALMARLMMPLMRTSGAETLSVAANVFIGQTEAPLVVKPYVAGMTRSELLTLMTGGLATIAGSVLGVYLTLGADPVALLATSVMAAPCSLYVAKILLPETAQSATAGVAVVARRGGHANVIDAAAGGAIDGMRVALNIAAMLIAFLALIAMVDFGLGLIHPGLSLARIGAVVFTPVAALVGVAAADVPALADLLGTKLVANEFVAYVKLAQEYEAVLSERSRMLATFALTGFANVGSIGILLGGIGAIAPERRAELAGLSLRALLGGFTATLINAAIAALLI
ncbi:MAG: hypothetical protein OXF27_03030 [Acidobacteria bacterium]|nr:hypothetical protein [Acidobacteriota bacterium]